eukprot:c21649_g3_i2.p1 GENE.c21649_g3_i2~~c21649_g3_i2.p1  ORF type:complete len:470 (+),score=179.38 c21649_g3_i2:49-1410(+)
MKVPLLPTAVTDSSDDSSNNKTIKLSPFRWLILFNFSFSAFNQCFFWITFSPISDFAVEYYSISSAQVQFFLTIGGIVFLPFTLLVLWLSKKGPRWIVLVALSLQLTSCFLKCIPCLWEDKFVRSHGSNNDYGIILIYLGQILNGMSGPLAMASPSLISQSWFGDGERTFSTAVGCLSANFGSAFGLLLGPYLVQSANDMYKIIYLQTGFSIIPFILSLIYFPNQPPNPPSISFQKSHNSSVQKSNLLTDIKIGIHNKGLVMFCLAGGFFSGVFNCWTGVISTIVKPAGYDHIDAGWFGFSATVASIIGGLVSGYVGDKFFQKNFKMLIISILLICCLFFIWFTLSLPSKFWDEELIPQSKITLLIAITGAGFCLGCTSPLIFEFAIELTYPLPETTSAVFLTFSITSGGLIFLCIPPSETPLMNIFMVGAVFITTIVVSLVPEKYQRANVQK